MTDFIASVGVIVSWAAVLAFITRRAERWETPVYVASFVAHIASAFGQIWITRDYYGFGDMMTYYYNGLMLSDLLSHDFGTFAPEALRLVLHQGEPILPGEMLAGGASTGTMNGIAGLFLLALGDSLWALCIFVALAAFLGKVLIYAAFRPVLGERHLRTVMYAVLLTPSVVFWSSGYLKEAIAMIALGPLVIGVSRVLAGKVFSGAVLAAAAFLLVGLVKPYILFPFALGVGAWLYTQRARQRGAAIVIKPVPLVVSAVIITLLLVGLGRLFPEYALERMAEKTARQQQLGESIDPGGSQYQLGNAQETTLAGQLAFAPLALITALFRPFVFEARNALMFINSLETAVIAFLFLQVFIRAKLRNVFARITDTPILAFSIVFTLTFAIAVGLASSNLGTLSRYRMPLFPFFLAVLLVVRRDTVTGPAGPDTPAVSTPR